jgi:hypothetical protein
MTDEPNGAVTSRVIVGWQSHTAADLSVEAATLLATVMRSEVVGLFVENDAMIDLAGLPFVRVLGPGDTLPKPVTPESMATAYARGAVVCRQTLSVHAGKAQVKWSFSTERGILSAKIRSVATATDFVVLSGNIHGFGAKQLMEELRSSPAEIRGVLITGLREIASQTGPVIAIDDGDKKGKQTIRLGARIAAAKKVGLIIFAVANNDAEAENIIARAGSLAGPKVTLTVHRFLPGSPQLIAAATSEFDPSFIVGDRQGEPFGDDKSVLSLLRACKAPVLLLR